MGNEVLLIVYVDVDDTLVRNVGVKRIPVPAVARHVRQLHEQGAELYCWSSGGTQYARESAEALGLADCFTAFLPKPQVLLDDQSRNEWRRCITIHPANCEGQSVEDYRRQVEAA